jgi:hypothetical protein
MSHTVLLVDETTGTQLVFLARAYQELREVRDSRLHLSKEPRARLRPRRQPASRLTAER